MTTSHKFKCRVFAFYLLPADLILHVIWQLFMYLAPFSDIRPFEGKPVELLQTVIGKLTDKYITFRDLLTYVIGPANSVAGFIINAFDGSGTFDERFLNNNRYVLKFPTDAGSRQIIDYGKQK